jgi:serine/threonine protein kinase/tetratricopeptide (TPR) repeat protein
MNCPKCQFNNPDTQRYCGECGTQLIPAKEMPVTETLVTPREELLTGSTFAGRYQIIEELGRGGMGKVYKVYDTKIKEKIALKLIKAEIARDKKTIERFSTELRLARKIRHKNICQMFDLGEERRSHFITMEFVPGEDLKSMIRMSGRLAVVTAINIAKQICGGLDEAHKLGVVHRDLKPSNIMIDKEGNARIMDFGIARSLESKGITGTGVMIGTPEYMSPEQVEGKEVDQRSDIYSLGIILYEMTTGQVPFEGETALSIAMKHKGDRPKNPKDINRNIPDDLSQLILKCLEKDKARRCQSAPDVHSELERIEKGIPLTEKVIHKQKPLTSKEITLTIGLRKVFIPALTIIVIAVIAASVWQFFLKKEPIAFLKEKPSVAVLPFDDLSPGRDQGHLCDGLAESIINALSKIKDLRIPARTSSFSFRGEERNISEIGQRLNVGTVLEGSLQKAGNKVRIIVKLINIDDESLLWSEQFNRELDDVFAIQDDITLAIVDKLKINLLGGEKDKLSKRYTENAEAYELYLKGRYFWNKRTNEAIEKGFEHFQQAIEIDPGFALAYTGIADCYIAGGGSYLGVSSKIAYEKAKEAAKKALAIDETLAEAHTSLGACESEGNWLLAEREFKRAIELNANYVTAHQWYAEHLCEMGRYEEAIAQAKLALELDPLSLTANTALGAFFYFAGRYDKAIEQLRYTLELDPNFLRAHYWLGLSCAQNAMFKDAIVEFQKAISLSGNGAEYLAALGFAHALAGDKSKAEVLLGQLKELSKSKYVSSIDLAMIYIALDDKEKAIALLEKGYEEGADRLSSLKVDPVFKSLRSDHRFQDLLRKMNFPE